MHPGIRFSVEDIPGNLASRMSKATIFTWHVPLTSEDIRAALAFAAVREARTTVAR